MNAKIKKIDTEYEKNAAKIAELQARQKELEKQRTEYENLDIIGLVRSMGVTRRTGRHHAGRPAESGSVRHH